MTITQKIKMALIYTGKSEAALARELGTTPQAFNQRMRAGRFRLEELEQIAELLGAEYVATFNFPDGTKF